MPFYEYECSACRYYAEVMQKITDKPLKKCPPCGKTTFTKLISAPVFRLKGSGWYETDFKSDKDNQRNLAASDKEEASSKTESKAETGVAAAGESKIETQADTKAEAKTEAKTEAKPEVKSDGKSAAKADAATSAPKPPAPTTRNVGARSASSKGSAT